MFQVKYTIDLISSSKIKLQPFFKEKNGCFYSSLFFSFKSKSEESKGF
jgi:hypothetical protein